MLIGQIEQEILEGIFWSYRLQPLSCSSTLDYLQIDLQEEEEAIWKSEPELARGNGINQPSLSSED